MKEKYTISTRISHVFATMTNELPITAAEIAEDTKNSSLLVTIFNN